MNYGAYGGEALQAKDCSPRSFTQRDRINSAIHDAQLRLDAAKRAAEILERNPDIEELLNLIQRF